MPHYTLQFTLRQSFFPPKLTQILTIYVAGNTLESCLNNGDSGCHRYFSAFSVSHSANEHFCVLVKFGNFVNHCQSTVKYSTAKYCTVSVF